jgi:hypothetical protein
VDKFNLSFDIYFLCRGGEDGIFNKCYQAACRSLISQGESRFVVGSDLLCYFYDRDVKNGTWVNGYGNDRMWYNNLQSSIQATSRGVTYGTSSIFYYPLPRPQ